MALVKITDHAARARARLATQFRHTVSHAAVLDAVSRQVQQIEDAFFDLLTIVLIDSSAGIQLDNLGAILGCQRGALTDAQFRAYLRAQVLLNRSSGTVPDILAVLSTVLTAHSGNAIVGRRYQPAAIVFRIQDALGSANPSVLAQLLKRARIGGVRGLLEWVTFTEATEGFRCLYDFTPEHSTALLSNIVAGVGSLLVTTATWGTFPMFVYIDRGTDAAEVVKVTAAAPSGPGTLFTLDKPTLFAHSIDAAVDLAPPQGFGTGKLAGVKEA